MNISKLVQWVMGAAPDNTVASASVSEGGVKIAATLELLKSGQKAKADLAACRQLEIQSQQSLGASRQLEIQSHQSLEASRQLEIQSQQTEALMRIELSEIRRTESATRQELTNTKAQRQLPNVLSKFPGIMEVVQQEDSGFFQMTLMKQAQVVTGELFKRIELHGNSDIAK